MPATVLSNSNYEIIDINDVPDPDDPENPDANYSSFELSFDYDDPDGDANAFQDDGGEPYGASLLVEFQFHNDGNYYSVDRTEYLVGVDGYSGTIYIDQPIRFDDREGVDITFTLTDGDGNQSNALLLTIDRPDGAN